MGAIGGALGSVAQIVSDVSRMASGSQRADVSRGADCERRTGPPGGVKGKGPPPPPPPSAKGKGKGPPPPPPPGKGKGKGKKGKGKSSDVTPSPTRAPNP